MELRLNRKLLNLNNENIYPFHMPGHKRNTEHYSESESFGKELSKMYELDITEIDGFDNLHDAKGIIKDAEKRAADLYKSEETHFLVNGSTCGILSAISAASKKGAKIIVARNCHISVYNAIELNELTPIYIYPELIIKDKVNSGICGSIRKEDVEKAIINNKDACAVVITSPTYEGILSDVVAIAEIAHEYDMPLIVDEAHGALFYLEGRSAVDAGADIVINSLHKTLPALTQTALIHINGKLVNRNAVRKYLRIYQTSSPSYVLLGSMDYAVEVMEEYGVRLYRDFCIRITEIKERLSKLRNLVYIEKDHLLNEGAFDSDESKVLIASKDTGLSGKDVYEILRYCYNLQPEMAAGDYVLLMTTVFDTDDGIKRLIKALYEIDDAIGNGSISEKYSDFINNDSKEALLESEKELNRLKSRLNDSSDKTVFAYPPGTPIITIGETVTEDTIEILTDAIQSRLDIKWID